MKTNIFQDIPMFVRMMSSGEERRELIEKLLANRKVLKDRNQKEQLLQQDATVEFEREFKPLLEPTRETQKTVARVAQTSEQTARALETLPRDIAAALPAAALPAPAGPAPPPRGDLRAAPQKFNDAGRARIEKLGPVAAAADMPANWRELLLDTGGIRPADAAKAWIKWVWRESTGARQARGQIWDQFEREVLELGGPRAPAGQKKKTGRGLKVSAPRSCDRLRRRIVRYYKDPEQLMDRLQVLAASVSAGNNSLEVINEASDILDRLHEDGDIDDALFEGLLRVFM